MIIDLPKINAMADAEMAKVPWDLQIRLDDKLYTVRPLSQADIRRFKDLKVAGGEEAKAFLSGLFVGEAPDWESLSTEQLNAFGAAVGAYLADRQNKRLKIMTRESEMQMKAQRAMERGE